MNGYMGSLLFVDLGRGETRVEALDPVHARRYLGGNGLAAKIIYDLCPPDIGALDEGNCIVFATGPLNGTPVWGCGRGHMAGISPQTGLFFDSNFGGDFASMLKGSGFDAVVICGKASSPVYLSIDEGDVHICDASAMWGKNTSDAHEMAIWEKGKGVQTAMIGPAGENLITYACIIMSGRRKSAAGRGGLGAVLGSKMLKGLVVRGSMRPQVADQQGLKAHLKSRIKGLREKGEDLTRYGTPVLVEKVNDMGKLGTRNNTREIFGKASLIGARYIHERYVQRNIGCRGCPLACGKEVRVPHGAFAGHTEKMPEYETLYAMGSMLENSDVVSIFNANTMCDEMGLDSISFGVTLAFVAECVEKGIINKGYLEREICFGDMAMLSDLVKMAAVKKGHIGEMLAMGSQALSQELGRDSSRLLYTS
ncbi:MAG: aldehyde ferredoxin oxidoreductase N-terminal domain-containing protein, partial [Thermodesulfobacteriota bacterium]|nr:aldehyde ferredoxin oxidoreductase N-terminal domain-containing protein [Thermodesulfobacteriota bacterium]